MDPGGGSISDRLRLAASKGQLDQIQACLQAGASFELDMDGRSALHYSAVNGHQEMTRFLLERGCPINTQDASGYTALHRAVSQGHVEVITVLLEHGCDVNTQDELVYQFITMLTLLLLASIYGFATSVDPDLTPQNEASDQGLHCLLLHGNAAVHEAAWNGYSKTLEQLVKYDVNVTVTNKAGFTSLHLAAQNGHNESSRILLYAGCDNDQKNNYGDTALHTAARYGHAGVTRILISARAKLHEQNKNGDTALHIAAALKRRKIAKLLVESGMDTSIRNKQNETAADVARRKDHTEIVVIIQSYARAPKVPLKEVNFQDNIRVIEDPVVVPNEDVPLPDKQDKKPEKGRKFFFFKKKKTKEKPPGPVPRGGVSPQRVGPGSRIQIGNSPVQGFFSKYVPRDGVQYYRDLAGNIKQGPVGYTPTCNCMPALNRLEKKVNDTKDNVYDHMQSSTQVMHEHIDEVDQRSSQRVHALEQYTRERFADEGTMCQQRIDARLQDHPQYPDARLHDHAQHPDARLHDHAQHPDNVRMQIQDMLEQNLEGYGHCLNHHHDDTALPNDNVFSDVHVMANGRLFKSRSDETLSQSDNQSGHFRKKSFYESRQAAMQQIRAWQVPSYSKDRNRVKVMDRVNPSQQKPHPMQQSSKTQYQPSINTQHQPSINKQQGTHVLPQIQRQNPMKSRTEASIHREADHFRNSPIQVHSTSKKVTGNDSTYMSMNGIQTQAVVHTRPGMSNSQSYGSPLSGNYAGHNASLNQNTSKLPQSRSYDSSQGLPRSHGDSHSNGYTQSQSPLTLGQTHMPARQNFSDREQNLKVLSKSHSDYSEMNAVKNSVRHPPVPQAHDSVEHGFTQKVSADNNRDSSPHWRYNQPYNGSHPTHSVSESPTKQRLVNGNKPEPVVRTPPAPVLRTSTTSDKVTHDIPKPTFTTFGYDDSNDGVAAPENTPEKNPELDAANDPTSSSTPRLTAESSSSQGEDAYKPAVSPYRRQDSYGFTPNNNDDYVEMSLGSLTLRQNMPTKLSDGLQNSDSNTQGHISQKWKEDPIRSNPNHSQVHSTPRSSSEPRATYSPHVNSPNINNHQYSPSNRPLPQQYSSPGDSNQSMYRSSPSQSQTPPTRGGATQTPPTRGGARPPTAPKPSYTPSSHPYNSGAYATIRDVQNPSVHNRQGSNLQNGDRSVYGTVRDVNDFRDRNQNYSVPSDYTVYNSLGQKSASKPQNPAFLEPTSQTTYQTYLTGDQTFSRENSPNICNNSKEDSSSNPDSGYSSRIYGTRSGGVNTSSAGSTPSSWLSADRSVSIPSNTNSPQSQYSNADYGGFPRNDYQDEVQNHIQTWYQRKLQETTQKVYDNWRAEQSPGRQRLNGLSPVPAQNSGNVPDYSSGRSDQYRGQSPYAAVNLYNNDDFAFRGSDV